jgi:hypothetical protein
MRFFEKFVCAVLCCCLWPQNPVGFSTNTAGETSRSSWDKLLHKQKLITIQNIEILSYCLKNDMIADRLILLDFDIKKSTSCA